MVSKNRMHAGAVLILLIAAVLIISPSSAITLGGDKGWVNFHTNEDSASIYVDGEFKGTTSSKVLTVDFYSTATPSHTVYAVKSGYQQSPSQTFTTPASGETTDIYLTMQPIASKGSVTVTSVPTGASVYIDGSYRGVTPYASSMDTGTYQISVSKSGYSTWSSSFTVYANQGTPVNAVLASEVKYGSISVTSNPSGADVYIDDEYKGVTPITVSNLIKGSHDVKISKDGYYAWSGATSVSEGGISYVSPTLSPKSAAAGTIFVSSNPSGASIYVDGVYKGVTPSPGVLTLDGIAAGTHSVRASLAGYNDNTVSASVVSDGMVSVSIPLTPAGGSTGQIQAVSTPAGANVYVDNEYKGITPVTFAYAAGQHKVDFSMTGYAGVSTTTIVRAGESVTVSVSLLPSSDQQSPAPLAALFAALGAAAVLAGRRE